MITNTLHIRFQDLESFMQEGSEASQNFSPLIQAKDELVFASIASFDKFLTGQKLHILSAILAKKPDSIYALAKIVDRDFANVSRDCTALEQKGFIKLEDANDERGSKIPRLVFDYNVITVHLPTKLVYSHTLAA